MYNILNWNTGLTEDTSSYFEIFEFVKSFLQDEFSIAVLQQIPYKTKTSEGEWNISDIYNKFVDFFQKRNIKHLKTRIITKNMSL